MTEPLDLLPGHKHGLLLASPVMAAAGAFGYVGAAVWAMLPAGLGAVVTRTLTLQPQRPAPAPRFVEAPAGLVHRLHVGNMGFGRAVQQCHWAASPVPVIVSLAGAPAECAHMADRLDETPGVAGIELSLWGSPPAAAPVITRAVREATSLPVLVKLSPAAPDLVALACGCIDAGADALVIGGPWPAWVPAAEDDAHPGWTGWLSGPALRPLVLAQVQQVAEAVVAPVIACGGAHGPADVRAYLRAGARAVQIGSAFLVQRET